VIALPNTPQKVKIADLKPYPRQDALFRPPSPAEIQLMAADMEARGLEHPIEIMPDHRDPAGHPVEDDIPPGDVGQGGLDLDGGDAAGRPEPKKKGDDPASRAQLEEFVRPAGPNEIR